MFLELRIGKGEFSFRVTRGKRHNIRVTRRDFIRPVVGGKIIKDGKIQQRA